MEQFRRENETPVDIGHYALQAVSCEQNDSESLARFISVMEARVSGKRKIEKPWIVEMVRTLGPEFRHRENRRHLDQRM